MAGKHSQFTPFYDRLGTDRIVGKPAKIAISIGAGATYSLLQYLSLPDKSVFLDQQCWILGAIITTAMLSLYISTDIVRNNLPLVEKFEGRFGVSEEVLKHWLTDRGYILAGLAFTAVNTSIGHLLGVPAEFHNSWFALTMIYLGLFAAGFTCGMGLYGIFSVIVMYLKLAPCLQQSLDLDSADGIGGIKPLGDALWFFSLLTGALGLLVTLYIFGVDWTNTHQQWARTLMLFWAATPYVVAITVVLLPGLAMRRSVQSFKQQKNSELIQEKAKVYSELKEFRDKSDQEIVAENRDLAEKLQIIQDKIEQLKTMRDSHIDKK